MKMAKFGVVATVLLVAAALLASPAAAADKVNVGFFVTKIAEAKNLPATSPITAERSLRAAGYRLPALDLSAELTEGIVAEVSRSLGLNVTTSTPETAFTQPQVDSYFSSFGSDLGAGRPPEDNPTPQKANPLLKGKGKKKGLYKRSPSDPV